MNKWIAFFGAKMRCFPSRSRSPAKAMRYAVYIPPKTFTTLALLQLLDWLLDGKGSLTLDGRL